jgi:hypothetical protein
MIRMAGIVGCPFNRSTPWLTRMVTRTRNQPPALRFEITSYPGYQLPVGILAVIFFDVKTGEETHSVLQTRGKGKIAHSEKMRR